MSLDIFTILLALAGALSVPLALYMIKANSRWTSREIFFTTTIRTVAPALLLGLILSIFLILKSPQISAFVISFTVVSIILAGRIDWTTCRIPNELLLLPSIINAIYIALNFDLSKFFILGITLFFLLISTTLTNLITKGKLGYGDIKLLLVLGLLTYWYNPIGIFYGIVIAFFLQLLLRFVWQRRNSDKQLKGAPFGYSLGLGVLLGLIIF